MSSGVPYSVGRRFMRFGLSDRGSTWNPHAPGFGGCPVGGCPCNVYQNIHGCPRIMPIASTLAHDARVKRAIWRAWQCGIKEAELVLGPWASANAAKLGTDGLADFEAVLDHESPDLVSWITNPASSPPEPIRNSPVMADILKFANRNRPASVPSSSHPAATPSSHA